METIIRLHWLRANGTDRGTVIRPDQLYPSVRAAVMEQLAGETGVFDLQLPFLDRRELRRRSEALRSLTFERHGNWVVTVMSVNMQVRTYAADLALSHPAWAHAGQETSP